MHFINYDHLPTSKLKYELDSTTTRPKPAHNFSQALVLLKFSHFQLCSNPDICEHIFTSVFGLKSFFCTLVVIMNINIFSYINFLFIYLSHIHTGETIFKNAHCIHPKHWHFILIHYTHSSACVYVNGYSQ